MQATKLWKPQSAFDPVLIPGWVANLQSPHAMTARELRNLGIYLGIAGAARGAHAEGDLITQTVDGRDLNDIWAEFQRTLALQNETRQRIVDLLTFPVQFPIEDVPQLATDDFEEASEFGVPKSIRESAGYYSMGYTFKWYDIATRFTWKFLADATAAQVESVHQAVLEADNRLVFSQVMKTVFNNVNLTATIRGQNYNVFKLWNADAVVPPTYKTTVFSGNHSHYLVTIKGTQAVTAVKGTHLDRAYEHLRHHGYSPAQGSLCFLMVNPQEGAQIRLIKAGATSTPWNRTRLDLLDSLATTDTPGAGDTNIGMYDFIPAVGQPGVLLSAQIAFGVTQPPDTFRGMNVIGAYGPILIIEEDYIPAGYMLLIASGGQANLQNPVGVREHANAQLRGLRLVKGPAPDYPLQESYYQRGFGTGIRQRGVAVVMQNPGSVVAYQIPTAYV